MVLRTIGREDDEAQRATIELALAFVDGCYESPSSTEVRDDPEQRALQEVPRTDSPVETISDQVQLDELSSEDLAALSTFVDEAASEPAASDVLPALTPPPPEQAQRHEQVIPVEGVQRKQPRKIRWDPNKARNQRKAELIYLRRQVLDLETQLTTMKGKKPKLTVVDPQLLDVDFRPSPSAPPDALDTTSVVASAWHDIAMRQGERRVKSERENVRLKLVLENQLKIAKSLETFLVRKTATKAVSAVQSNGPSENPYGNAHVVVCFACGNSQEVDLLPAPRKHLYHVYPATKDNRTDAEIFEDLSIGLDASYAELDALYETTGLAHMERPHFSAQIHCDGRISMYLELFANKVLPFDLHSTGNAVWHHFLHAKERTPSRQYYYDSPKTLDATEDSIVESFNLLLSAKGTRANFRVNQICRRYIEHDRVVIVWRAFIDPVEFSDAPLSGVRFLEKGYIVIKKPSTAKSGNYTLLQPCHIFVPLFTGGWTEDDHPQVGAVTDFVLSTTATNISAMSEMLETVLLEQTMQCAG